MEGELSLLSKTLLVGALERALGRYLTRTHDSRDLLKTLTGKVIAVNAPPLIETVYLCPTPDGIQLQTEFQGCPDVTVTASPLVFIKLSVRGLRRADLFSGEITLAGDSMVAEKMQRLFQVSELQWRKAAGELATPILADQLAAGAQSIGAWGRETVASLQQDLGEFLREESREVPSNLEAQDFLSDVDRLRDDCDRLEARIDRLQTLLAGHRPATD